MELETKIYTTLRQIHAGQQVPNFIQNRPGYVEDMTRHILMLFRFTEYIFIQNQLRTGLEMETSARSLLSF